MEHKHIKFHEGHITWHGEDKPSEAIMEAFEAMYEFVQKHEKEIAELKRSKAEKPVIYGPPPIRLEDMYFNPDK